MKRLSMYMFSCSRKEYGEIIGLLEKFHIKFNDGGIVVSFEIDEASSVFCEIDERMKALNTAGTPVIKYEKRDYDNADYLRAFDFAPYGYPYPKVLPEEGESYLTRIYDKSLLCHSCCGKRVQISAIELDAVRKNKSGGVGGVYWLNDILVANQSFFENHFSAFTDVETIEIADHKTGACSPDLVQIKIKNILPVKLQFSTKTISKCDSCGFLRYIRKDDSILSMGKNDFSGDFYLSQESFGEGYFSDRLIIVSQKVYRLLKHLKIKFRAEPIF